MKNWGTRFFVILVAVGLNPMVAQWGWAQNPNRLIFFNTLSDLLRGDLWQWATTKEVARHLFIYPERFVVLGMGTTNWPYRMGEVIIAGTVGNPSYLWANPEYPYKVQSLGEAQLPWAQLAIVDPESRLETVFEKIQDLHAYLIESFRKEGIEMCGVTIEATTSQVEYSVTYMLPKTGLDLTVPGGASAYLRSFQDEGPSSWIMQGVYVDDSMAQRCGIPPGQPLLLVGTNKNTQQGGLIRMAKVQRASVHYFPIDRFEVLKADLLVSDIRVHEGRITVEVLNQGALTAEHVKVRLVFPDTEREFETVLPRVKPKEEMSVKFPVKRLQRDRIIVAVVDPDNEILESEEANNRMAIKHGIFGW